MDRPSFLTAPGEVAGRIARFDWAATPLGPIDDWPQSLRTTVSMILNSGFPTYMAWGPELTSFYNDAYRHILGDKPDALGRPFSKVWEEAWEVIGPIARRAMEGHASYFENLPLTLERRGYPEQTWWTFSYSPIRDESGAVGGVLCTVHETTGELLARRELQAQRERLADWFRQAPGFMCVLSGPEHRYELVNDSYADLIGRRPALGRPVAEVLPEVVEQGFIGLLDGVYRSGEPFVGSAVPIDLLRSGEYATHYVDFVYQPIRDGTGQVTGIFVEGMDVTERTLAAERQSLLVNELNHRVKNSLATVQSIVTQTLRSAPTLGDAKTAIEARILSLARAHDILTEQVWSGASVQDLVHRALQPFVPAGERRIEMDGDRARVSPEQALGLSLALHELATNAVKYGALSPAGGEVRVNWSCEQAEDGAKLRLCWAESGGPPVVPPSRKGFGSRLLRGLAAQTGGSVDLRYDLKGVICEMVMPISPPRDAPVVQPSRATAA
jgi:two-component sensor histidine kinase/PAS domain-containing protein